MMPPLNRSSDSYQIKFVANLRQLAFAYTSGPLFDWTNGDLSCPVASNNTAVRVKITRTAAFEPLAQWPRLRTVELPV